MNKKYIFMIAAIFYMLDAHACEQDNTDAQLPAEIQQAIATAHQTGEYDNIYASLVKLIMLSHDTQAVPTFTKALDEIDNSPLYQIVNKRIDLNSKALAAVTPETLERAQTRLIQNGMSYQEARTRIQIIEKKQAKEDLYRELAKNSNDGVQSHPTRVERFLNLRTEIEQLEQALPQRQTLSEGMEKFNRSLSALRVAKGLAK